jgi:para-nitrobenzyl esterase
MLLLLFLINAALISYGKIDAAESSECGLSTDLKTDPRVVQIDNGKIKGVCQTLSLIDPDVGNRTEQVLSWKGIPFAQPPVGLLRFRSPQPSLNWTKTKTTDKYSKTCIQAGGGFDMSEDCLYLNVFAPLAQNRDQKPLPVYIYIHGGGLVSGSAATVKLINAVAVSKFILVSFNYRLGPFGFMYLPEAGIDGNMALLDQHLALKWVQQNIGEFNGDPNRVTIGGQSAGAWSIGYHLVYKPSWSLFTNAILIKRFRSRIKIDFINK